MSKAELFQNLQALTTDFHTLACELDIGDERTEVFEMYEVLRRIQRRGAASEMLAATNPLLCPGIADDEDWVDFDDEDDD
ncbi:hypothetical protein JJ672_20750 [Klebsiella pneumoniae]|uniref:hypothetical protein n=1 Tax=Klebsiella pneumoniae TaxID=573 RepID=UPI0008FB8C39|nr:hypothetical protein [Klebsiella pneumoniae]ART01793.1 hypothetical protein B8O09_22770 [Klebsiella pneumoniae]ASC23282.1 hypothetical protein AM386_16330 [Klebsiella pneumoniae]OKN58319.1 hypothetical protein AM420_000516 [Klebsiella pneumoniae]UMD22384.1 hypothetical protein JJ672_20750 [Klebsiella pneumoniae]HBT9225142.1 hypothetical protein [Klebsiella pneumoniae]